METEPASGAARARSLAVLLVVGLLVGCSESEMSSRGLQRFLTGESVRAVEVRGASRWANLYRFDETVRTTLVLPLSARLAVPWTVILPHERRFKTPVWIEIDILEGNERRSLLRQERSILDSGTWYEERLDLGEESPGTIELEIRFRATDPAGVGENLAKTRVALAALEVWSDDPPQTGTTPTDVILIAVDTLRADHLSTYGAERPTPNIDALGASGVVFESAFSPSTWTLPSFASVFTSTYPQRHQVTGETARLPEGLTTLGEVFARHGYRTIGLHGGGWIGRETGFSRGFDQFIKGQGVADFEQRLAPRLENVGSAPLLLFFHTYDVHQPYYSSPEEYHELYTDPSYDSPFRLRTNRIAAKGGRATLQLTEPDVQLVNDLYDGEVRFVDDSLPAIFELLDRHRPNRPRLVVLFSDHGESFGESGRLLHSSGPYRELSHVPLIVAGDGIPTGRRVKEVVETLGLLPTLIDLLGFTDEAVRGFDGRSFAHLLHPEPERKRTRSYAIAQREPRLSADAQWAAADAQWAVRTSSWSLVNAREGTYLYDRKNDIRELVDVGAEHPEVVERLEAFYRRRADGGAVEVPGEVTLGDATLDELRALGYLE